MNNTFATSMCFAREPSPASRVLHALGLHPDFVTRDFTGLMNLALRITAFPLNTFLGKDLVIAMATGAQTVGNLLKLRSLTTFTSRADS